MLRRIGGWLNRLVLLVSVAVLLSACATAPKAPPRDCVETSGQYGTLESAAKELANARVAMFDLDRLPPDLTAAQLIEQAHAGQYLPGSHYEELQEFTCVLDIQGNGYILKIYNPQTGCLILYDCSCTTYRLDGPVYREPGIHDPNNIRCNCQN